MPPDDIDGSIATTYLYLRDEYIKGLKRPIFFSEHGVAIVKDGFRKKYHARADHVMQSGPMWHERAQYVAPKYKGNLKVGFPKSDELINALGRSNSIRNEIINEFDLDPKEPIICFAPTWYDADCYNPGSTQMLEKLESIGYRNFLTLFHEFDAVGKTLNGKRYIKEANKNRFLLAADLLIGDYSSIVLEYAILNKPIVQANPHDRSDFFYIWREPDYGIFQIGEIADKGSIEGAVERALKDPGKYEFLRKYWVNRVFYNPGRAAKASADAIESLTAAYQPKRKRFLFF